MSAADWEPEIDDIKAMRAENGGADLKAFMRAQIAAGKARRDDAPKPAAPPKPPGHRPGAWPTGTSPPGPPPERQIPKHIWDAAVRHYRNEEHFPDQPCDCGNCP
ncbi:hypothetical protein TUSST3_08760 [Streptomyces sp. TUS-ST3]|uniref:hypothetical protein n=1 Tax=Streptomyces sp. TUS-ST3 TaxID=3025591 RepID=UPI0024E054D5|nr:hypothetical protein [Streptomyces sp. TUS-ST3]GLP64256.1 hypothetical protein TUSST3_08760 [Streptomyces sp. TUS-ST3]